MLKDNRTKSTKTRAGNIPARRSGAAPDGGVGGAVPTGGGQAAAPAVIDKGEEALAQRAVDKIKEIAGGLTGRIRGNEEAIERIEGLLTELRQYSGNPSGSPQSATIDEKLDRQLATQTRLLEDTVAELRTKLDSRMDGIESRLVDMRSTSAPANTNTRTLAEHIHANEELAQRMRSEDFDTRALARNPIKIRGINLLAHPKSFYTRADPVMGLAELGPYGTTLQGMQLMQLLTERSDVISMVPRIGLAGRETWSFPRKTRDSHLAYVTTTITAAVAPTDTSITVDDTRGFINDSVIRVHHASGTFSFYIAVADGTTLNLLDGPGGSPAQAGFTATPSSELVTSENFGSTAESGTKPVTIFKVERPSRTVKNFALACIVTRQRLTNVASLQREIEQELIVGARRNFSFHFLYGDGTGNQAHGLSEDADAQTYLWSAGQSGDFRVDAVLRAANEIHSDDTVWLTVNKRDWTTMIAEKASDGHYAIPSAMGPVIVTNLPNVKAVGEFPVIRDAAVRIGDFFLWEPNATAEWGDKEDSAVIVGFIDDQLLTNETTVLYESSWEVAVRDVGAYVIGNWDSQPA